MCIYGQRFHTHLFGATISAKSASACRASGLVMPERRILKLSYDTRSAAWSKRLCLDGAKWSASTPLSILEVYGLSVPSR